MDNETAIGGGAPVPPDLTGDFAGGRGPLFWLALRTAIFTVLTLGLYRFWMKTRLRRWYWSSIRMGGLPLEYVGDPIEKLLGFLVAVVILAFYIGIVNLLLMFASFSLLQGNFAAYLLSFVGVVPIWFYAQYRACRYVLARTRWRGLRFGLEPGAWGYAFRALWYWFLTLASAGLLLPLMTFQLEKYRSNRTFFGDARMDQGGRWTLLYRSMKWIFFAAVLALLGTGLLGAGNEGLGVVLLVVALFMAGFGAVYYRVDSLRRMTAAKRLNGITLTLAASPMRILWIHVFGYTLALLAALLPFAVFGFLFLSLQSVETLVELGLDDLPLLFDGMDRWVIVALGVMSYFAIFLSWSALTHALVTLPVIRHYARGLTLSQSARLGTIRQRPRDEHSEAEGFAEALDVGASI